ncbi:hypothetical protein [Sporosarcina sp. BP05]|nr:hypothetical protein [Sporosarcina sp. BP05]
MIFHEGHSTGSNYQVIGTKGFKEVSKHIERELLTTYSMLI